MRFLLLLLLLPLLAACGGTSASIEQVMEGAVNARVFDDDQCFVTVPSGADAYLKPDPQQPPIGDSMAGENEALQVVTLADGSLWYQLFDGVWVRADNTAYEMRGDCAP